MHKLTDIALLMDYPLKLAEQLRPQLQGLRKQRRLTQAKLGEAIGVTQARIVEIEANPGAVSLQQVMQVLGVLGAALVIRDNEAGSSNERQAAAIPATDKDSVSSTPRRGPKKGSW